MQNNKSKMTYNSTIRGMKALIGFIMEQLTYEQAMNIIEDPDTERTYREELVMMYKNAKDKEQKKLAQALMIEDDLRNERITSEEAIQFLEQIEQYYDTNTTDRADLQATLY